MPAAAHDRHVDAPGRLRVAFPVAETGFDPQATSDLYSDHVQRGDLRHALRLRLPRAALQARAAAPPRRCREIDDGGRTWTIRVRPGIYFADDPAFNGKRRELTAADYVYSWKRLLDPRVRSPFSWYLQGKIVGADKRASTRRARAASSTTTRRSTGLHAVDRYTLRIRLNEPDYILFGYLCSSPMSAVAREVVERYGDANGWTMDHPVGTGPFMLKSWRRGQQIVLEANPNFPRRAFSRERPTPADRARFAERCKARSCRSSTASRSRSSRNRIRACSRSTAARSITSTCRPSSSDRAIDSADRLKPDYAARGVTLERLTQPALQYAYFNMEDPVVGGYTQRADRAAPRDRAWRSTTRS